MAIERKDESLFLIKHKISIKGFEPQELNPRFRFNFYSNGRCNRRLVSK